MLVEPEYCDMINSFLKNLPDEISLEENSKTRWELIKIKIKYLSINYCKEKSKRTKQKIASIENELKQIENQNHLKINMI